MATIAIDAMGGDDAPATIVRGAVRFAQEHSQHVVLLVGDEAAVSASLKEASTDALPNIKIIHAPEVIEMNEHPVEALRTKKAASLPLAVGLVKEGKADAVLSAGNTGALVAAGTIGLRTLPGVRRAGIAASLPSLTGRFVLMDVGANVNCKAAHLVQYAQMGDLLFRTLFDKTDDEPVRVGLLSVGSEEGKGSAMIKEAHAALTGSNLTFLGNVEGHKLFEGVADVVICDGVVGNVVLKTAEGLSENLAKMIYSHMVRAFDNKPDPRIGKAMQYFKDEVDWRSVGGAALLGVNGTVVMSHGRSDVDAIYGGIRVATECCEHELNDRIVRALEASKAGATS